MAAALPPTQKPLCKRNIVTLRVGCPHCGPRAGGGTPPTGCFASGENEKKPAGKCTFLTGFFLHFHCARGLSFRFPKLHAERSLYNQFSQSQNGCRGDPPAAGVQGTSSPLPKSPLPGLFKNLAYFFTKRAYYDKVIARFVITLIVWREGCE